MHKFFKFVIFFILLLSCIGPSSAAEPSIASKIFDFFFPVVTVELRNNATHGLHVKCGVEEWNDQLLMLNAGDSISWQFREILFPLKWCYVHINKENEGVFWASHVRLQCTHCRWSINGDGVYYYREKLQRWDKHRLFLGPVELINV